MTSHFLSDFQYTGGGTTTLSPPAAGGAIISPTGVLQAVISPGGVATPAILTSPGMKMKCVCCFELNS